VNSATPRILIVKLSAIGDVVHTLPALNSLRRHFPRAHITWLVEAGAADLLAGHPALDRVIVSRRKQWARGIGTRRWRQHLGQIHRFLQDLRDTRYDIIFDFQAALKGAMLIALARGRRKIGFGPGMEHQEHSHLVLNEKIPIVSMEIHALERGLKLLEAVGIFTKKVEYRLPVTPDARRSTSRWLAQNADNATRPAVAINPMAQWKTKLWPPDRFAVLADRIIDDHRAMVYFTGGPADREIIENILQHMRHNAVNLAGKTSLIELAAVYDHMAVVVTTDTGPMHIAAAVEKPVVALFGPTAQWRTGPYGAGHHVVTAGIACRPCFKRTCATAASCMRSISVDQVLAHVKAVLDQTSDSATGRSN
jgi:3-deoxy-D-manno-octulosonic-acid transferase/heptosyltransferase-1